jgi:hypothetical protein
MRNACTMLVCEPKGKRVLERHFHRREYNIKMDCKEIICIYMDCFNLKAGASGRLL